METLGYLAGREVGAQHAQDDKLSLRWLLDDVITASSGARCPDLAFDLIGQGLDATRIREFGDLTQQVEPSSRMADIGPSDPPRRGLALSAVEPPTEGRHRSAGRLVFSVDLS